MSRSKKKRGKLDTTALLDIHDALCDVLCLVEVVASSLEGGSHRYVSGLGLEKLQEQHDNLGRAIRALEAVLRFAMAASHDRGHRCNTTSTTD